MKRSLLIFLLAATAAPPAFAQEDAPDRPVEISALPGGQGQYAGRALFPVEDVLEALRRSIGFSFIFDSSILAGKMMPKVDRAASPETALRSELDQIDLSLHKVAPNTYAITEAGDAAPGLTLSGPPAAIDPPPIDTILVMGSAPIAGATTGSKRIFNISADDLAYLSITSPAEAIYDLPQSLASFTRSNTALYGATAGINLADLRGLAPRRTMVLVNGRRRTLTTGGNGSIGGVDLNSIADPFLERIEVQNLPGGARYGGGAVAGTINFVTKSGFEGLETGARFGISERGDSEEISLHAVGGTHLGFGDFTVGLNVTRNEGLVGADREFSATPYGFGANGVRQPPPVGEFLPGYGGSMTTDKGLVSGVILSDGSFASLPDVYVPNPDGTLSPFIGALDQLYNWEGPQSLVLPNDRILGMLSFNADIGGEWRFFADAQAGLSATDNFLAPLPGTRGQGIDPVVGDAAVIPLSNPTLPQPIRDLATNAYGASAAGIVFDHRYAELGPRRHEIDRRYVDVVAGVERSGGGGSSLSLAYRFSHNRVVARDKDRIDANKLEIALDPARCAATAGCALVDYFSAPAISDSAVAFIIIPEVRRTIAIEEHEITTAAAKTIAFRDGFDGEVAVGVELRRALLSDRDEIPAGTAPIARLRGADNHGALNTLEAFAEIETPLVISAGFPGEVDGSLALRGTKSSRFDVSMNFEGGLDWRPVDGLALFTRQLVGERTPDLIELFAVGSRLEMFFRDPCAAAVRSPEVAANCASAGPLGVGPGFVQTSPLASRTFYGNPELDAEKIRTSVYGATVSPTDILQGIPGRMQITATWLDFDIEDAILAPEDAIGACYRSVGFSSPACGLNPRTGQPSIIRDTVTQQIVSFADVLHNQGRFLWRGLDLELRYSIQPNIAFIDSVWVSALHTYTHRVESSDGAGKIERLEGLVAFPKHRTLASAGAEFGRWSVVGYANRRGRAVTIRGGPPETHIPAALYLDATVRFDLSDRAYLQASLQNITDKEPAITAFNDIGNFAPEFYDPVGRRYALSVRLSF